MATVRHVVLVRFRDDVPTAERERFATAVSAVATIPYVRGFRAGWGIEPALYLRSSERWDWALSLDLDLADADRYAADPVHRSAAAEVAHLAERFAILDFRID
jgi:hypothetical protein